MPAGPPIIFGYKCGKRGDLDAAFRAKLTSFPPWGILFSSLTEAELRYGLAKKAGSRSAGTRNPGVSRYQNHRPFRYSRRAFLLGTVGAV